MSKVSILFAIFACASSALPAAAQVTYEPSLSPADEDDVDEVEELPASSGPPSTTVLKAAADEGTAPLSEELGFSQEELRSRFAYLAAAAVGSSKPWQGYTLEMGAVVANDLVAGLFVGGGTFEESGFLEERAYDVNGKTRGAGGSLRVFSSHFTHLSLEGLAGYASWEGRVDPHGSDEDEVESAASKLSSGFRATGFFAAVAVGFTWIWDSGLLVEWTPVGMRMSTMQQKDYDRDTPAVDKAVKFAVERAAFYGLTNLKVGYLF